MHGDLSAYNVLWHAGRPWIIDVPQALNLHTHPGGYEYLRRDVANLERYFARYGLSCGDFAARVVAPLPARTARALAAQNFAHSP